MSKQQFSRFLSVLLAVAFLTTGFERATVQKMWHGNSPVILSHIKGSLAVSDAGGKYYLDYNGKMVGDSLLVSGKDTIRLAWEGTRLATVTCKGQTFKKSK